jgi:hypothetical protein
MGEAMENNQDRLDITGISTRNHKEDARTGKIALKAYLHAIDRAEDNRCGCGPLQTVAHILLTCPDHGDL